MSKSGPEPYVIAALVEMRQMGGARTPYGAHGKGVFKAFQLGYLEDVGGLYELNLRGQDIADEAIQLAKGKRK